jgi:hypothetical protein
VRNEIHDVIFAHQKGEVRSPGTPMRE